MPCHEFKLGWLITTLSEANKQTNKYRYTIKTVNIAWLPVWTVNYNTFSI